MQRREYCSHKFHATLFNVCPNQGHCEICYWKQGTFPSNWYVLRCFTNCSIIYPVGPVYYFLGHPYKTISSGALKFYVVFKNMTSEPLDHCEFVDPQGNHFISPYQTQNIYRLSSDKNYQSQLSNKQEY